ncbi:MarR family winged helix-turn-helix transcriptional regulator [Leptospira sp. SA-E8]|uniref:MarR family winged helix-turn-helix transcriptional regulator n=1 Tax=Leptospira sp. SA-E8 TaxID=3422259 RepID=UPI003EB85418
MRKMEDKTPREERQIGFLLSQVGSISASKFAKRIEPLDITPSHSGILRLLAHMDGLSQRELCEKLSILPSRLVLLIDQMEEKDLVVRDPDPNDRRSYSLSLTTKGKKIMGQLSGLAKEHNEEMCSGLNQEDRKNLAKILSKIAGAQGLSPGIHPGYKGSAK